MSKSKLNFVGWMQRWMDSVAGQTFLNYAYSWGASIVILGTLFKLTHLEGANLMLFIGMGTEVFVFFISAFDRPFNAEERELTDDVSLDDEIEDDTVEDDGQPGGGIILGGGVIGGGVIGAAAEPGMAAAVGGEPGQMVGGVTGVVGGVIGAAPVTDEMEELTRTYAEKLQQLTDTLERVEQQCARLTTDSEEMTNLNRTLTGINTIYELQLKGASQQVGTIDRINEQTRHMAQQIEELNGVYARMIKALTVNMKNAGGPVE